MIRPLCSTDRLEAFFVDRGGDTLLVTFNEMGLRANGQRFWGDTIAGRLNISALGFVSREPNWFPRADVVEALAVLKPVLAGRFAARITYGHSQGGYAAIKYSRPLAATTIVAFCPQFSIDPGDIVDPRFNKHFLGKPHGGMRIEPGDASVAPYVFYDPHVGPDAEHVDRIAAAIPIRPVQVPFSGHQTIKLFANTTFARRLLDACRTDDLTALAALRREARRRDTARPYHMALSLAATRPRLAAAVFAAHRRDISPDMWRHICTRLARAGFAADALAWMSEAIAQASDDADSRAAYALIAVEAGHPAEAIDALEAGLAIAPNSQRLLQLRDRLQ